MGERLTYWKCPKCLGTGRRFEHWMSEPEPCFSCDGTGNALVSGETERHKRRLAEFDRAQRIDGEKLRRFGERK